ncbi:MAG: transglutaminase domain-containing protein [Bacillota bacterium]
MRQAVDRMIVLMAVSVLAGTLSLSIATGLGSGYAHVAPTLAAWMLAATLLGYAICTYPRIVLILTMVSVTVVSIAWRLWPDRVTALAWGVIPAIPLLHVTLCLLISISFFVLILWQGDVLWLVAAGCTAFTVQWLFYVDVAFRYLVVHLIAGMSLSAYLAVKRQVSDVGHSARRAAVYGLFIVFVVAGVSQILPNHFRPITIDAVSRRLAEAFPSLQDLRGPEGYGTGLRFQFSLARSGFGKNPDELGGPVSTDHTPVLRLRVRGEAVPQTLYLRGVIRNTYTGRAWYSRGCEYGEYAGGAAISAGPAPSVPANVLVLEFAVLEGPVTTLFAVLEPKTARLADGPFLADQDSNLLSPRALNRGEVYSVLSRVPQYSSGQIRELSGEHRTWQADPDMGPYLRLPAPLPQRVVDLARQVAGEGHPYDQARAVETYLRTIPYSLDPPPTPPGRDFVDFFLFDLRRGYCSYHSTAMAVMLRTLGIPSRWVEGYAVKFTADHETLDITNAHAHAWVEAYFPGYGWVPFEPTPSFPPVDHEQSLPKETTAAGGVSVGPGGATLALPSLRDLVDDSDIRFPSGEGARASRNGPSPVLIFAAALALLGARAGWSAVGIRRRERLSASAAHINPAASVRRAYAGLVSLLADFGLSPLPAETPARYAARLAERFPDEGLRLRALADWYGQARYGRDIDPATAHVAIDSAQKLRSALGRLLIRELGPVRFCWLRLIVSRGATRQRRISRD